MAEQGIEPEAVARSREDGRITKADVLAHQSAAASAPAPSPAKPAPAAPSATRTSEGDAGRTMERVPMTRLRKRTAERLLQAQQQAAILTTFNEVNMQALLDVRNRHKDAFEKRHGVKLGFMSFFVKAAVEALRKFPVVNACVDGDDILYHGYFDIGVAVGSERGLVVPILRNAEQLSFADIERQIADFGQRAREGKLTLEELTGGTFTISNGGIFGSLLSTPILNPPQSAILGMHKTQDRPVAENGQVVIRPMMYLALSYDHRIIDGREAVQCLDTLRQCLEDPARLLLQV
jgi:2-oxoglutarate dehydrogenase E2 component (dihydrolipoamide succinyltransferase)